MKDPFLDLKSGEYPCKDCGWWFGLETGQGESLGCGECRRFPPIQIEKDEKGFPIGIWPVTKESECCGEFGSNK